MSLTRDQLVLAVQSHRRNFDEQTALNQSTSAPIKDFRTIGKNLCAALLIKTQFCPERGLFLCPKLEEHFVFGFLVLETMERVDQLGVIWTELDKGPYTKDIIALIMKELGVIRYYIKKCLAAVEFIHGRDVRLGVGWATMRDMQWAKLSVIHLQIVDFGSLRLAIAEQNNTVSS